MTTTTRTRTYVVDTHALLWYFAADRCLSRRSRNLIEAAMAGTLSIGVSAISLAEALIAVEKQKVRLSRGLMDLVDDVPGLNVVPFDVEVFREMTALPSKLELHDRVIAATCKQYGATLITRDPALVGVVRTAW